MHSFRLLLVLKFCLLSLLAQSSDATLQKDALVGAISDSIICKDDPTQTYALYLPSNYTAERAWPIVYCFDPGARGKRPVERFQQAAERYGYIIVGSNNSRNGMRTNMSVPIVAMLRDTHQRFRIDDRRLYSADFLAEPALPPQSPCEGISPVPLLQAEASPTAPSPRPSPLPSSAAQAGRTSIIAR